jgi:hypothetical protein
MEFLKSNNSSNLLLKKGATRRDADKTDIRSQIRDRSLRNSIGFVAPFIIQSDSDLIST